MKCTICMFDINFDWKTITMYSYLFCYVLFVLRSGHLDRKQYHLRLDLSKQFLVVDWLGSIFLYHHLVSLFGIILEWARIHVWVGIMVSFQLVKDFCSDSSIKSISGCCRCCCCCQSYKLDICRWSHTKTETNSNWKGRTATMMCYGGLQSNSLMTKNWLQVMIS